MKVKALKSFSGKVSMAKGDVRNIETKEVLEDLISHGYVEAVVESTAPAAETQKMSESQKESEVQDTAKGKKRK